MNIHNNNNPTVGEAYEKFLQSLVKDALETSVEVGICPDDALHNILECLSEDAFRALEDATFGKE